MKNDIDKNCIYESSNETSICNPGQSRHEHINCFLNVNASEMKTSTELYYLSILLASMSPFCARNLKIIVQYSKSYKDFVKKDKLQFYE